MNEKQQPYNGQIDEALLTAFALDELEGPERDLVEAALKTDHKAQEAVEEIRAVAGHLRDALTHDVEYAPSASLRAMIEQRLEGNTPTVVRDDAGPIAGRRRRRWAFLAMTSAAVLLLAVAIPAISRQGRPSNVAMDMAPMASPAEADSLSVSASAESLPAESGEVAMDEAVEMDAPRESATEAFAGKNADSYRASKPAAGARYYNENAKSGSSMGRMGEGEPSAPGAAKKGSASYSFDQPVADNMSESQTGQARMKTGASFSDKGLPAKDAARRVAGLDPSKTPAPAQPWSASQAAGPGAIPVPYPTAEPPAGGQAPLVQSPMMPRAKGAPPMEQPSSSPYPPIQAAPSPTLPAAPQPQVELKQQAEVFAGQQMGDRSGQTQERQGGEKQKYGYAEQMGAEEAPYRAAQPARPAPEQNAPGIAGPVQIETMEGLDATILRGNKRDVEAVRRTIQEKEAASARGRQQAGQGYGGGMGGMGGYGREAGQPAAGEPLAESLYADTPLKSEEREVITSPSTLETLGQGGRQAGRQLGLGTEQYMPVVENPFLSPIEEPESTVSADVDTGSYPNVRRFLENNQTPPPGAVRVEEMVNYFAYDYPQPTDDTPFSVNMETASCPWNEPNRLVRIGLKAKEIDPAERGPSNLVFLLDVSGSMRDPNKLPLVKDGMAMLVEQLTEDDRVSIVTYAGDAGLVLESTEGTERNKILEKIESLNAAGSTHGSAGIQMAYDQAMAHFVTKGNNRVILCTDGDLNVGVTDDNELVKLIQEKASSGVFLTVVGVGTGNLKDAKLEQLADKGNGSYAYVDGLEEAKKVFVEQVSGSLVTVAKDVKIQIEFNPAKVQSYRLIGYENRLLAAQDFDDDMKDAGEIGAGHSVTFFYEVVPTDLPVGQIATLNRATTNLRYQRIMSNALTEVAESGELLALKLRYKLPDEQQSRLLEVPVMDSGKRFGEASSEFRFAAAVAAFGMLLRGSQYNQGLTFSAVEEFAAGAADNDPQGRRGEFVELVRRARSLYGDTTRVGADAMLPSAAAEMAPAEPQAAPPQQ